jgi:hypothetical protein
VGVTIDGGFHGPGSYTRADTRRFIAGSAVEGSGTTSPVYTVFHTKDQGAFDLTVMPDASR